MTAPSEEIPVTAAGRAETAHGTPRLAVENLRILMTPRRGRPEADVIDEISFTVQPGHVLGLVGESGSGKTTVALALLGLFKRGLKLGGGKVLVDGQDILALPEHDLQKLRGRTIAYVPQDPGSALNPVLKVGTQLREVFTIHGGDPDRLTDVLAEAGLEDPVPILAAYPHQLSGGQQQRVALAMAFACRPRLIVLDEPTTGLDVTTQRRVLDTVRGLCRTYQVAAVYITHDLAVVAEIADHVAVLYAGRLIEMGQARELFATPAHPYTRGLMRAVPVLAGTYELHGMAGSPPRPGSRPVGCFFQPRCEFAVAQCEQRQPELITVSETGHVARCVRAVEIKALSSTVTLARERPAPPAEEPVLTISGVSVSYTDKLVLHDVNLVVGARQSVAIVGTSGSGKTTLARCVVGLHKDWSGTITVRRPGPPGRCPQPDARPAAPDPVRLAEPVLLAQPAADRRPDRRASARALPQAFRRGTPAADRGRADLRRAAGVVRGPLSRRAFRRGTPAGRAGPRPGPRPRPARLRRGHLGAGRIGAGGDRRAAAAAAGRARALAAVHHA